MIKLIGEEAPVKLNRLAREECKLRLLQDILFDLQVCEIEQWDKLEYLTELKNLIDTIIKKEDSEVIPKVTPPTNR
jgi:hypothetical protein